MVVASPRLSQLRHSSPCQLISFTSEMAIDSGTVIKEHQQPQDSLHPEEVTYRRKQQTVPGDKVV